MVPTTPATTGPLKHTTHCLFTSVTHFKFHFIHVHISPKFLHNIESVEPKPEISYSTKKMDTGLVWFDFSCLHWCRLSPECIPIRIARHSVGMWWILKTLMALRKCRAIVDISRACLLPLLMGTPLATMYASPMVST